jgi:hypothetical protein
MFNAKAGPVMLSACPEMPAVALHFRSLHTVLFGIDREIWNPGQ